MLSCAWTKTNKYSIIILQSIIKMTNTKTELGGGGRRGEKSLINIEPWDFKDNGGFVSVHHDMIHTFIVSFELAEACVCVKAEKKYKAERGGHGLN